MKRYSHEHVISIRILLDETIKIMMPKLPLNPLLPEFFFRRFSERSSR